MRTVPSSSVKHAAALPATRKFPVPTTDLMIASVALVHDLTLVTHNTTDFRNVPDLRIEDWLTP